MAEQDGRGTRLADLRWQRRHGWFLRYVVVSMTWALWRRKRSIDESVTVAARVGKDVAKLVNEARASATTVRRLTWAILALTAVNAGFVIYSALR
jgi:predicted nucleic acid-binding protein